MSQKRRTLTGASGAPLSSGPTSGSAPSAHEIARRVLRSQGKDPEFESDQATMREVAQSWGWVEEEARSLLDKLRAHAEISLAAVAASIRRGRELEAKRERHQKDGSDLGVLGREFLEDNREQQAHLHTYKHEWVVSKAKELWTLDPEMSSDDLRGKLRLLFGGYYPTAKELKRIRKQIQGGGRKR